MNYIIFNEDGLSDWSSLVYSTAKILRKYFEDPLFAVTVLTSWLSAAFGIARFLKTGPCRLVSNDGILSGYFQLGFILNFTYIFLLLNVRGTFMIWSFITSNFLGMAIYGIPFFYVSK